MRIGFNLLLWTTHVTDALLPITAELRAAGYDGVEVPLFEGTPAHYRGLGQRLRDQGLATTAITVIPDEARNPISPVAAHRQGAVDYLAWATECAAELGSSLLCGPFHQPLGAFSGGGPTEAERAHAADVHRRAAATAAGAGVTLVMEYLNRFECYFVNTMADALAHAARVDHANFGVMHDTFHANIEERDPIGVIAESQAFLRHIHISENDRGTPGRGHLPWPEILAAIRASGYDGWLTIEAFGRALPGLAAATRVWRDLSPSPRQVFIEGLALIREGIAPRGVGP
jgi:D-psicose/D-tagatose/L-ribulose 3-epimerase